MRTRFFFLPVFLFAACGGGVSSTPDGGGGCIEPTEGEKCGSGDVACQPASGVCCAGYMWVCHDGAWDKSGVGCACSAGQLFACGTSTECDSTSQFCEDELSGIDAGADGGGGDSFSCGALTADCASNPTCACVEAHSPCSLGAFASCAEQNGQVTVRCAGE